MCKNATYLQLHIYPLSWGQVILLGVVGFVSDKSLIKCMLKLSLPCGDLTAATKPQGKDYNENHFIKGDFS